MSMTQKTVRCSLTTAILAAGREPAFFLFLMRVSSCVLSQLIFLNSLISLLVMILDVNTSGKLGISRRKSHLSQL